MVKNLRELHGPLSIMEQMLAEGNVRTLATPFQLAMCKFLAITETHRTWAHRFGMSPRQYQRIRKRLADWKKKDARHVIEKVIGSITCPCGCNYNLIEDRVNPSYVTDLGQKNLNSIKKAQEIFCTSKKKLKLK